MLERRSIVLKKRRTIMKKYLIALSLFALSFLVDVSPIRSFTFSLLDEVTQGPYAFAAMGQDIPRGKCKGHGSCLTDPPPN